VQYLPNRPERFLYGDWSSSQVHRSLFAGTGFTDLLVPPFCCNTPPPDVPWGRYSRDAKEPSLLGFGSVRVLTKIRVLFSFKFFTSAENLGSVFMFSVLSSVLHCVQKKTSHFFLA